MNLRFGGSMHRILYITLMCTAACGNENVIEKQENLSPTIIILSHADGAGILEGYVESFRAQVSDDDNEFDELEVAWFVGDQQYDLCAC